MEVKLTSYKTKTFSFNFYPFEKDDILKFLDDKLKQGWILKEANFNNQSAKFIKKESNLKYAISIQKDYGKTYETYDSGVLEFLDTCRLCGWKHICTSNGVFFFYNDTDENPIPIYDNEIEYKTIQEKKEEFRNHFSSNKRISFTTIISTLYIYTIINSNVSIFDYFIISLFLIDLAIYLYIRYSKNIIFREKGLYVLGWLLFLIIIVYTRYSFSLPLLLLSIFTIIILIILFKVKHPFFLENIYISLITLSLLTLFAFIL